MVGGCALSNFSGSETSYSVVFSTIDNFADGGFVGLFANSFTDVAGNFNDASSGATIMYDTVGPRPTLSTENGFIIITFSEVPTNFTKSSLSISYYYGNQKASGLGAGSGINNFAAHGTSGKSWRFIVNDLYSNYRDDTYGDGGDDDGYDGDGDDDGDDDDDDSNNGGGDEDDNGGDDGYVGRKRKKKER